jgi:hypothetical protein
MIKGWKKEKEKGFQHWWAGGRSWPSQAQRVHARGRRPSCDPSRGDGAGAQGADAVAAGPHVSESRGGGDGATVRWRRRTGRPRGKKPGRRWARRRFAAGGPVLGQRGGALAQGGAGEPRGGLNLARGAGRGLSAGRWRSSVAGITVGELRARDWGGGVVF